MKFNDLISSFLKGLNSSKIVVNNKKEETPNTDYAALFPIILLFTSALLGEFFNNSPLKEIFHSITIFLSKIVVIFILLIVFSREVVFKIIFPKLTSRVENLLNKIALPSIIFKESISFKKTTTIEEVEDFKPIEFSDLADDDFWQEKNLSKIRSRMLVFSIISFLLSSLFLIIFFIVNNSFKDFYIGLFIFFFCVFIITSLYFFNLRSLSKKFLNKDGFNKERAKILEHADEKIITSIFGIQEASIKVEGLLKPKTISVLGREKNVRPENTLLVTNLRLLMIQLAITGGEDLIDVINYGQQNFIFNRAELAGQAKELLTNRSLSEILQFAVKEIKYDEIKEIEFKKEKIIIEKITGEKTAYVFFEKINYAHFQDAVSPYLKVKIV